MNFFLYYCVGNGREGECRCQDGHVAITITQVLSEQDSKGPEITLATQHETPFTEIGGLIRNKRIM
jgi:hypothetical protein